MDRPVLVAELGSGGMADVFLAMRRGIGGFTKLVVIKRLRSDVLEGDAVTMFHDEARISARLNHPNVVHTQQVGFDGEHFRLEMEYLDGQPLHRLMHRAQREGRTIDRGIAVAIVHGVLAGLHYAHELCDYDGSPLSIVHRDVSPQNVFITYDGSVKLVDFGIAKAAGQATVTKLGVVKGKVRYMAPEQAAGVDVDRRTDVFAVGVVLWQLLTGERFWGATDELAVVHRLVSGDYPRSARAVNPGVSEELDAIVARALAQAPSERFGSAFDFQQALEQCVPEANGANKRLARLTTDIFADVRGKVREAIEKAAARPVEADDEPTKVGPLPGAISVEAPPVTTSAFPTERRRSLAGLVGLATTAVAATVALFLVLRDRPEPQRLVSAARRPSVTVTVSPSEVAAPATTSVSAAASASSAKPRPRHGGAQRGERPPIDAGAREEPARGGATGVVTRRGAGLAADQGDPWDAGAR